MRAREFLLLEKKFFFESRGLGARKAGEEFISTSNPNDKIYIDSVSFFPQGKNEYVNFQDLLAELESVKKQLAPAEISVIGNFKENSHKAFGVAIFQRPDKTKVAFIKPYAKVSFDPTQNSWDNQTGIPGYKYNSKSAVKTQAGMMPQDVLIKKQNNLTAEEIVNQIAEKFGQDSPLTYIAQQIAAGQNYPIKIAAPQGVSFTAFRDYFCELLHPIALQTGKYNGNAGEAAAKFLGDSGFEGATINFGKDKTEGLSDSKMMTPDGRMIRVSSKGAVGAEASSKNLLDSVNDLKSTNPNLAKRYREVISIIQDMSSNGQYRGPLVLALSYGIITDDDFSKIESFKNIPPVDLETADLDAMGVSNGLQLLMYQRNVDNPNNVNLYFHTISAVAHKVAEMVNESTNFSKAASDILNNGALVQVWTLAKETPTEWSIEGFNTLWPSKTVTGVKFSAGKNYASTNIKGNFTFKILMNDAKDIEDEAPSSTTQKIERPKQEPRSKR